MTGRAAIAFASASVLVAVVAIGAGLMVIGSPGHIRKERLDEIRSTDLAALAGAISSYSHAYHSLPARLAYLQRGRTLRLALQDPEGKPYLYRAIATTSYELCADFALAAGKAARDAAPQSILSRHKAGRRCFQIEVRPLARG